MFNLVRIINLIVVAIFSFSPLLVMGTVTKSGNLLFNVLTFWVAFVVVSTILSVIYDVITEHGTFRRWIFPAIGFAGVMMAFVFPFTSAYLIGWVTLDSGYQMGCAFVIMYNMIKIGMGD